jgi:hypothetical protein
MGRKVAVIWIKNGREMNTGQRMEGDKVDKWIKGRKNVGEHF